MKRIKQFCFLTILVILTGNTNKLLAQKEALYPSFTDRKISPGKCKYYIDPQRGNDKNTGTSINKSWKTFKRVNEMILAAGDQLIITNPGSFTQSLYIMANGTKALPVKISFAPGRYDLFTDSAFKTIFNI